MLLRNVYSASQQSARYSELASEIEEPKASFWLNGGRQPPRHPDLASESSSTCRGTPELRLRKMWADEGVLSISENT